MDGNAWKCRVAKAPSSSLHSAAGTSYTDVRSRFARIDSQIRAHRLIRADHFGVPELSLCLRIAFRDTENLQNHRFEAICANRLNAMKIRVFLRIDSRESPQFALRIAAMGHRRSGPFSKFSLGGLIAYLLHSGLGYKSRSLSNMLGCLTNVLLDSHAVKCHPDHGASPICPQETEHCTLNVAYANCQPQNFAQGSLFRLSLWSSELQEFAGSSMSNHIFMQTRQQQKCTTFA